SGTRLGRLKEPLGVAGAGDGGAVRLRTAGQALGRPGPTVVQVHVVLPVQAVPAEQVDGGFGHGAEGLARPQRGGVGRLRSLGAAARGLEAAYLAAAETSWKAARMSTHACATAWKASIVCA